ncbi:MAG TPA: PDR/VanB family oxidoreductase [Mycobacterium sp.]|nr:MAG: oxidoreductase [Mycobacterium sp.]HOB47821.1 PDR/VanB family oxidoreductase [Mycobacterium sp.]HPZ94879.1 PDR/VanB family oxidoreductase [Mycobacterium sp.]
MVLPALRLAGAAVTGLWAVTGLRRPLPPRVRDHTLTLRVTGREVVARDENVVALTLAAPDGGDLPTWHPGAHLDLHLPSGRIRQYSLCGDPDRRDSYRIAVRRIPNGGGGSIEVHDALPVGSLITTNGPRNAFPLAVPGYGSPARRLRFIAGGIGITPILPMLAMAERMGVEWSMIYVGRSAESIPFLDEVGRFGDKVVIRTDDTAGVPEADDLLGDCSCSTAIYACGPADMITLIRSRLVGRDDLELHFERFAAPPVTDGAPFTVTLESTGSTMEVAADETLLAALRRTGVAAAYSCQQGFCGTCRTRVLSGTVEHRDTLLTGPEREAGMMLTCVSRAPAGGNLTLDL